MFTAILKALAALPALIQALRDLGAWMEQVKLDAWISDLGDISAKLKAADKPEDRLKAALDMHNLLKRL